ncbi:MAG: hypothetical protein WD512_07180 [Candidatus Paceibacterota bacterium]
MDNRSIDIGELSEGQILKNYKDLCSKLNIVPATGKSKILQLKNIERYLEYSKDGHKFVITKIYDEPKEYKGRGRDRLYGKDMVNAILYQFETFSYDNMATTLIIKNMGLGNNNVKAFRNFPVGVASIFEIEKQVVVDFWQAYYSHLNNHVISSIKYISDNDLGEVKEVMMGIEGKNHREVTYREKNIIDIHKENAKLSLGIDKTFMDYYTNSLYNKEYERFMNNDDRITISRTYKTYNVKPHNGHDSFDLNAIRETLKSYMWGRFSGRISEKKFNDIFKSLTSNNSYIFVEKAKSIQNSWGNHEASMRLMMNR